MRILWLTWKDREHSLAGGAEVISSELGKRLASDGHEVVFITGGFKSAAGEVEKDGYKIIRLGNRLTVYWQAYRYVKAHYQTWPDVVIEEVNTIPFFSRFYLKGVKRQLLFHQLARQIWFYEMIFPFNLIGYVLEPIYLRLLSKDKAIAMSESTRQDLQRYGFKAKSIEVISEGIQLKPVELLRTVTKFDRPTILSLGAMRAMKRTLDQVKAFEIAKAKLPDLQMVVAGDDSGPYGQKVTRYIEASKYRDDIKIMGRVGSDEKQNLLQKSHIITVTSSKEGWGLIVTEAASQGTPAVVYNADGLRDSVRDGKTGLITSTNSPQGIAEKIVLLLDDKQLYETLRVSAWEWSKHITFDNCYQDFKRVVF